MRIATLAAVLVLCSTLGAQLSLSVTQPCGPGSVSVTVTGAAPFSQLFNLVQLTPAVPTGSGPIFGLGVTGSDSIIAQVLSPLGTAPFHVSADALGGYVWTVCGTPVPISIPVDVVTVEWSPLGYLGHTPVSNIVLAM
jgi:hypothetical protein